MKKTKIICTLGPSTDEVSEITKVVKAGMDIARINMSHGTHESHQKIIDNLNLVKEHLSSNIKLMIDTKGPEMRIGNFQKGEIFLKANHMFTLTSRGILGNEKIVSISYPPLFEEIEIGKKIYANNGMTVLKVKNKDKENIYCKVLFGGKLTNRKGINVPNIVPRNVFLSEVDKKDLLFAIKNNADYIAASFVSNQQNVLDMRKFLDENGGKNIKLISKIENASGVKNAEKILKVCDGIMVARGDLGVEIPLEKIPPIQKKIIRLCDFYNKPVIVATEMLESMTTSVRPTRAEVSDVSNAIYDQATAVMLSGETAVGKHPELVVKTMKKIIIETEKNVK